MVEVTGWRVEDGVMVMMTVTRMVEGLPAGVEMMLVEVVVRVVGAGGGDGAGWTPAVVS